MPSLKKKKKVKEKVTLILCQIKMNYNIAIKIKLKQSSKHIIIIENSLWSPFLFWDHFSLFLTK